MSDKGTPPVVSPGGAFGKILIERGLVTSEDLERCLAVQRERERRGDFVRLGAILVEQGLLTPVQVAEVLEAQAITILVCEACGAQYNIRRYSPVKRYDCPKCHGTLVHPERLNNVAVQDQLEEKRPKAPPKPQLAGSDTVRIDAKLAEQTGTGTARIRELRRLGSYEILGEIARGGMGVIYKARQVDLDRVVALKTLRNEEKLMPDAVERFRREARAIAALRHPNIVAVHEVGEVQEIQYFTMEFIEGLPLDRRLLRGPLPPEDAVDIVVPIAEALHYAHLEGVLHRDVKPANIIVDARGTPFLVDFGIARRKAERTKLDEPEDELLGSIPYMSPEYVAGSAYDERCDLYSLGVVLYEALSGHECFPFYDRSTTRLLERIVAEPPVPIKQRVTSLDDDLAAIVMRGIARDRDIRYATTLDFAADLRNWRRGLSVAANPRGPLRRGVDNLRESVSVTIPVLGGLALLSAILAFLAHGEVSEVRRLLEAERLRAATEAHDRDEALCRALLDLGEARSARGDVPGALEAYGRAINLFDRPGSGLRAVAEAFDRRGRLLIARGQGNDTEDGRKDLARAYDLDSRFGQQRR